MAKKAPQPLSTDELEEKIDLKVGARISEVSQAVFKNLFDEKVPLLKAEIKKETDNKVSQLIYGLLIAVALVLLVIFVDYHFFKRDYNQLYLQTQESFSQEMRDLVNENANQKIDIQKELDQLQARQEFLEQLIVGK